MFRITPETDAILQTSYDDATKRLIDMTNQTCIIALDKTLSAIRRQKRCYIDSATSTASIAKRMNRVLVEVKEAVQ